MACCFADHAIGLSTQLQTRHEIIDVALRFADGKATESELKTAHDRGRELYNTTSAAAKAAAWATWAAAATAVAAATWAASAASAAAGAASAAERAERAAAWTANASESESVVRANSDNEKAQQSRLYGLFLPTTIETEWKTTATASLAQSLYLGDRSVAPVLADELEMSGYDGIWIRILRENPEVYYRGMSFIDKLRGEL
jgi:hypothetical protein